MSMPSEKAKNFKGTLIRLLGYLRPYWFWLLVVLAAAVGGAAFNIISPKILGEGTTIIFEGVMKKLRGVPGAGIDFERIAPILLLLVVLYILSAVFTYLEHYIMAGLAQKTVYNLREDVSAKLSRLPLKYFDSHSHGEILSRVTNDIDLIGTTLQQSLMLLVTSLVTVSGILVMMLTISPWMTMIALVTLPLSYMVTARIAAYAQKNFAAQQKELGRLNSYVEETYSGHMIVKAFGNEEKATRRFNMINEKLYESSWRAQFISGIIMPLIGFINNIGYVLVCFAGSILVAQGRIPIGNLQAFIQYSKQFTHPIVHFASIANIIQSTMAAAERVFELLDEVEEIPDSAEALSAFSPRGDVMFNSVRFGYSAEKIIINKMNIDVKPGQTVAIVGPTGAGKTTLVNLLMRFYEVSGGKITIDGLDIRDIKRGSLRSVFGMVLQDTWLFKGTIRDNIAYGRIGAVEDEIVRAAKAAYADRFIRNLPDGYDTVLNEEASNISQGQKQLLTIARAILADPAILILDEATSSVDTRTELLIQKAMADLMKGRTSFVIAHRLSTIHSADKILVMNEGEVVEKGTHSQLLAMKGFYRELYESQFAEKPSFKAG
jgi:ATP-binding cassette subfamily B protein